LAARIHVAFQFEMKGISTSAQESDGRQVTDSTERLLFDAATLTITLDGAVFRNLDPIGFAVFEAIVRLQRDTSLPVRPAALEAQPGLKGKKVARELKKLPAELRALVRGKGGSGRWIELPR
jgi:hypothetical protein